MHMYAEHDFGVDVRSRADRGQVAPYPVKGPVCPIAATSSVMMLTRAVQSNLKIEDVQQRQPPDRVFIEQKSVGGHTRGVANVRAVTYQTEDMVGYFDNR